jgi:hypothetical protein
LRRWAIPWIFSRWWSINTETRRAWNVFVICCSVCLPWASSAVAASRVEAIGLSISANPSPQAEFSGSLIKRVEGRRLEAQVYAKADRIRIEYKYAVRTELGLSSIEIIRLDRQESWFLIARLRVIVPVPIQSQDILPLHASLPGEQSRQLLGDATVAGRPSVLYEVLTEYHGRRERYYEWVDRSTGVVLKLVSQNRDWSIEYQRIHFSPQPDQYFEEPVRYTRWTRPSLEERRG